MSTALLPANSGMTISGRIIPPSQFVPAHMKTTIGPLIFDEHMFTQINWSVQILSKQYPIKLT